MVSTTSLFFVLKSMKSPEGFKMVGVGWQGGLAQSADSVDSKRSTDGTWRMGRHGETSEEFRKAVTRARQVAVGMERSPRKVWRRLYYSLRDRGWGLGQLPWQADLKGAP